VWRQPLPDTPDIDVFEHVIADVWGEPIEDNTRLIAAAPSLYYACGLRWRDNPEHHRKEVYTVEGEVVFTSEHEGLRGASEAMGFIANEQNAAIARVEGDTE